jgi:hypothetical protein
MDKPTEYFGHMVYEELLRKNKQEFNCELCSIQFLTPRRLDEHFAKIHPDDLSARFKCQECDQSFFYREFILHRQLNIPAHENPDRDRPELVCFQCGHQSESRYEMDKHGETVHQSANIYKCPECPLQFPTFSKLSLHMHSLLRKTWGTHCHICELKVTNPWNLNKHLLTEHNIPTNVCEICNKSHLTTHRLEDHMQIHRKQQKKSEIIAEKNRLLELQNRSAQLKRKLKLEHQMEIAEAKNSGKVSEAEEAEQRLKALEETSRTEFSSSRSVLCPCPVCGKMLNSSSVASHVRIVHEKKTGSVRCRQCPEVFGRKCDQVAHMVAAHGYGEF